MRTSPKTRRWKASTGSSTRRPSTAPRWKELATGDFIRRFGGAVTSSSSRYTVDLTHVAFQNTPIPASQVMIAQAPQLLEQLRRIVGTQNVLSAERSDLLVYECDGFVIEKNCPDVVVFPDDHGATCAEIVKLCNAADVPFLPRGAGTSLAGGCLPVGGGVMIVLTRMKRDSRRSTCAIATPSSSRAWSMCG